MAMRIKISKPGYDVLTETDPKNLIFDAELNHLKTYGYGTLSRTLAASGSTVVAVAHNLGYKPLVIAYFRTTNNGNWSVTESGCITGAWSRLSMEAEVAVFVDTTNLYFYIKNQAASSRTIEIKYEVFMEGVA